MKNIHVQKTVGPNIDQEYNAHINMCSRESCSVLPARFLAGVFIFLTAFLIGITAASFTSMWIDARALTQGFEPIETLQRSDTQQRPDPCSNRDGIRLTLLRLNARNSDGSREYFSVIDVLNSGPQAIKFLDADFRVSNDDAHKTGAIAYMNEGNAYYRNTIDPNRSLQFRIRSSKPDEIVRAILWYQVGQEPTWRYLETQFINENYKLNTCPQFIEQPAEPHTLPDPADQVPLHKNNRPSVSKRLLLND